LIRSVPRFQRPAFHRALTYVPHAVMIMQA
jgi:hypothetical protein